MRVCYDKLLDLLKSKNLNKSDLVSVAHINSNAVADIGKGNMLSVNALTNICELFLCQPSEIMEFRYDNLEINGYYRKKLIRMLTRPNVIKIPTDDGENIRFYMVEQDPRTGNLNQGQVRFMTELTRDSSPELDMMWERDHTGSSVPVDVEKIVKELEKNGFTDEYNKSDIIREAKVNTNEPYNDM